jgi:hypothetical protein
MVCFERAQFHTVEEWSVLKGHGSTAAEGWSVLKGHSFSCAANAAEMRL